MTKFILASLAVLTFSSPSFAHESQATCVDLAFDSAVHYCYKLYNRRSRAFASCKLGAAHTYEAILMSEITDFSQICKPTFLRSCDSGRKLMLAKEAEFCEKN